MFDLFLAYSDFGRHAFADLEGEVLMTRGPVDTEYYAPSFSSNDIVALGRCLPHKGFDRIIRSLPCGPRLKIIGSRADQDYFRYLNELASGKSVVFVEGLEDTAVRDVLRSAGRFVHASCHSDYQQRFYAKPELLGLAPLEALACGTPTLVSNAGSLSELAILNGCRVFSGDHELTELLEAHAMGGLRWPTPTSIHSDVEAKFGMLQYGDQILSHIQGLTRQ